MITTECQTDGRRNGPKRLYYVRIGPRRRAAGGAGGRLEDALSTRTTRGRKVRAERQSRQAQGCGRCLQASKDRTAEQSGRATQRQPARSRVSRGRPCKGFFALASNRGRLPHLTPGFPSFLRRLERPLRLPNSVPSPPRQRRHAAASQVQLLMTPSRPRMSPTTLMDLSLTPALHHRSAAPPPVSSAAPFAPRARALCLGSAPATLLGG